MKKKMLLSTVMFLVMTIFFSVLSFLLDSSLCYSLAITAGTMLYHFFMRLVVGFVVDGIKHNKFDYNRKWFKERRYEKSFFKVIRIKSWKSVIPTFVPEQFDVKKFSVEDIVMATCQSEVVHEIIMVLSFVPILFSIAFGTITVFVITSIIAALFDFVFVLLQRYNRPRLMKLIRKNEHKR